MKWRLVFVASSVIAVVACATSAISVTPNCTGSETACGPICANFQTDSDNCGKCGNVCPSPQACVAGSCSSVCPGRDDVICGADAGKPVCTNTQTDNLNCGTCGTRCPNGEVCHAGSCSGSCSSAQTKCTPEAGFPYCADLKTDNANCGACGKACPSGEWCAGGACSSSCDSQQTLCADAGVAYCADLQTDNANCGSCGATCTGTLKNCINGTCSSECTTAQTLCTPDGGTPYCADTKTDNANCGTCGNVCPTAKPLCAGGTCGNRTVQQCQTGTDPETAAPWVVCSVDSTGAWISHNNSGGANYHALQICQSLGYTTVSQYGGTYANCVCGYNQTSASCSSPGSETFDGAGNCGSDGYGIILCLTVQWKCT